MESRLYKVLDIFSEFTDGSLWPKVTIDVNCARFSPGARFQKGVIFGGIDFHIYKYRDIAAVPIDSNPNIVQIIGFYKDDDSR